MTQPLSPARISDPESYNQLSTEQKRIYDRWEKDFDKVSLCGNQLQFVTNQDEFIVEAAILQNPLSIRFAHPPFKDNKKLGLIAVKLNGIAIYFLSNRLKKDIEIVRESIKNKPTQFLGLEKARILFFSKIPLNYEIKRNLVSDFNFLETKIAPTFVRDIFVRRFNQAHLVPYEIRKCTWDLMTEIMCCVSTEVAKHLLERETGQVTKVADKDLEEPPFTFECRLGKGFKRQVQREALIMAHQHSISYSVGKTCIEGGNAILFFFNQRKMAIVGEISLFLSVQALEEQDLFEDLVVDDIEPSLDTIRIIRNQVYMQKVHNQNKGTKIPLNQYKEIFQFLLDDVSDAEKKRFYIKSQIFEAKINMTKKIMAEELGISLNNLVIVPQANFHIDLELSVMPNGEVLLHDDRKTIDFLEEGKKNYWLDPQENLLLEDYLDSAYMNLPTGDYLQKKRLAILQSHGLTVHLLAASFESYSQKIILNYCNGIFREGSSLKDKKFTFITTGISKPQELVFHELFQEAYISLFSDIELYGVEGVSQFIANYQGGIRCLTIEGNSIH